jgi:hypothetical protein
MMPQGIYKRNEAKDGWMPCCSKCGEPYPDAEPADVKNYPDDGLVAVFFKCENCKDENGEPLESMFYYKPYKPTTRIS